MKIRRGSWPLSVDERLSRVIHLQELSLQDFAAPAAPAAAAPTPAPLAPAAPRRRRSRIAAACFLVLLATQALGLRRIRVNEVPRRNATVEVLDRRMGELEGIEVEHATLQGRALELTTVQQQFEDLQRSKSAVLRHNEDLQRRVESLEFTERRNAALQQRVEELGHVESQYQALEKDTLDNAMKAESEHHAREKEYLRTTQDSNEARDITERDAREMELQQITAEAFALGKTVPPRSFDLVLAYLHQAALIFVAALVAALAAILAYNGRKVQPTPTEVPPTVLKVVASEATRGVGAPQSEPHPSPLAAIAAALLEDNSASWHSTRVPALPVKRRLTYGDPVTPKRLRLCSCASCSTLRRPLQPRRSSFEDDPKKFEHTSLLASSEPWLAPHPRCSLAESGGGKSTSRRRWSALTPPRLQSGSAALPPLSPS